MKQLPINPSLALFDQLPATAMLRPKPSAQYLGISMASLWRLIKRGDLKTYKITQRTTGIMVRDLRAYIANRKVG